MVEKEKKSQASEELMDISKLSEEEKSQFCLAPCPHYLVNLPNLPTKCIGVCKLPKNHPQTIHMCTSGIPSHVWT